MRTWNACGQCHLDDGRPTSEFRFYDVPENGVIESTCDRGHRTATIFDQRKFEMLSEMAVKAIVDGYYRDAIVSFAGSLERLYEYFVQVVCIKNGISVENYDALRKSVGNRTEREFGAFLAAFLLETRASAPVLPQPMETRRNNVVHKGRFATFEEAFHFGEAVFACAFPVINVLRAETYALAIHSISINDSRTKATEARRKGLHVSHMAVFTPLCLSAQASADLKTVLLNYADRPYLGSGAQDFDVKETMAERFARAGI